MKVVIVGGVAGGASAAARIRRLDEHAQIIIFEKTGYISYANCGLPYYIGGTIKDKSALTLQTPDSFWDRFRIDVRVLHEVTDIDKNNKCVTVKNLKSGKEYTETYDKLLISTGAKPSIPNMEGIQNDKIFTIRNVEDTFKIKDFIDREKPTKAAVIGGGFIGVEMSENLIKQGIDVTLVEYSDHLLANLDYDMAAAVHSKMEENNVNLMLKTAVTGFSESNNKVNIKTSNGNFSADFVILCIGVTPDTDLADKAGLSKGIKGSITVNEKHETSAKDIYAVGDAVQVKNFITKDETVLFLAGPANKQGRIAADNICGLESSYKGSQGSSIIKVFDMTVAATGINEAQAKKIGIKYEKVILSPVSHAGYYPGGKVMTLKLLFEKETEKILGAQIFGFDGVDKRIDVIATAIRLNAEVTKLAELDLAYAPPYSSAKDPVNMAGFIAENIITGKVKQFYFEDTENLVKDKNAFLLDSRTAYEYDKGHAEGFVNIPVDDIRERIEEIPKDKKIYVMCQSGLRSYITCRILSGNGYDCYNFSGGYRFYDIVKRGKKIAEKALPCGLER